MLFFKNIIYIKASSGIENAAPLKTKNQAILEMRKSAAWWPRRRTTGSLWFWMARNS